MLTQTILKKEYNNKKSEIQSRLNEFKKIGQERSKEEIFMELCFCLCTPQSKAKRVAIAINKKNLKKLINAEYDIIVDLLRTNARFHNNKAKYIVEARIIIPQIKKLSSDAILAREYLVKNIKGLGYKESSHFLRNIGYRNLCIIDRHVINLMHELEVFKTNEPPKNPKQYLAMESEIKNFAKKIKIDVDELDLLLWSINTGYVFR